MATIALAGRRIDAADGPRRFPLAMADTVRARLEAYFARVGAAHLVVSAACGADLLAVEAAHRSRLGAGDITLVLPFSVERFRVTSVTDRPGEWGALYDRAVADAGRAGRLVLLGLEETEDAYDAATRRIVEEAAARAPARVCIVTEGAVRGAVDHSNALGVYARERDLPVDQISTRGDGEPLVLAADPDFRP